MAHRNVIGLLAISVGVVGTIVYSYRYRPEPSLATLFVTIVMCGVTAIYALLTFGIFEQNRAMAQASVDSTKVMEQSLRFSYASHLLFSTLSTRDIRLGKHEDCRIIEDEDYRAALAQYGEGQEPAEFVFAVVHNVGRGAATNLSIDSEYRVVDSGNTNKKYTVKKSALVQTLEPDKSVALLIFVSRVPTADDKVSINSAILTASDFYRDALKESVQPLTISPSNHHTSPEPSCVIRLE